MKNCFTLLLLLSVLCSKGQVNGYARITLIDGPTLTVSGANETYDQFNVGDKVLIIQMQDDVIGSNTSNNSNFGNLFSIANAGKYETAQIGAIMRPGLLPTRITLTAPLNNVYNTGANGNVQIVTFPTLGSGNYTTTSNITALPWNGSTGGVVAFQVNGILTLDHSITADNAGFRGGVADVSTNPYGSCNTSTYYNAQHAFYGNKGEGIYKVANANYAAGMGKILTGGGGGNTINSGGGGGGNFTAGGDGYHGWNCSSGTGGLGGIALGPHTNGNRVFMGGGGGGGEANDNSNNRGGTGGGIVVIKANVISTQGAGSGIRISANGENAPVVANDGAGGGGAGGSIVLDVSNFNIDASKPVTIAASGGNGGNVGVASQHGGGGGGGQGVVIFSVPLPVSNVTLVTSNGLGGLNWTGGTRASSGAGSNNVGIMTAAITVLPLKLISFIASSNDNGVILSWKTQNEQNVSHFVMERSANGNSFEAIATKLASGTTQNIQSYSYTDVKTATATTYYRLRMVDADGRYTYSRVLVVRGANATGADMRVFPNPVSSQSTVFVRSDVSGTATIRIMNMQGANLFGQTALVTKGENALALNKLSGLPAGLYSLQVVVSNRTYMERILVQ